MTFPTRVRGRGFQAERYQDSGRLNDSRLCETLGFRPDASLSAVIKLLERNGVGGTYLLSAL
jgi:hypothetical protein